MMALSIRRVIWSDTSVVFAMPASFYERRHHAGAAICGPTTVTSGIGCSAHCGGSTPAWPHYC